MIIEVDLRDAEREPQIASLPPIKGIDGDVEGHLLNGNDGACVFFDQQRRTCTIYDTRPLVCRVFDCETRTEPCAWK